ncbi:MAG: RNaseH domain-containing protein, partial [Dehalococcoidia bacterium]|nr:RNaseH domain-containing protein [Dehalococcoidia bacterium]
MDLLMFEASRSSGVTLNGELAPLTKNRGSGPSLFVGVPFRYGYYPVPKIEAGATLQDQTDLTAAVRGRLDGFGFSLAHLRVVEVDHPRPDEFHVQATLHNLITHHFGHVNADDVPALVEELFGAPERKSRGPEKPIKTIELGPRVEANKRRLDKAFGRGSAIDLVFLCRREREAEIFQSIVALLFGDRVRVVRYGIPDGVHGTQKKLDGEARRTRTQRAAARRQSWIELAEQIKASHPRSPVIVQAAREYDGLEEDTVNKDVGRNTLATVAGCSVQYLLPPGEGRAAEYMHRVQAALYDLLFAHSGLGPVPAAVVAAAFPKTTAPRTIVGISIVSQAASRRGRPEGAELAVAFKIDVATGKISGRIGRAAGRAFDAGEFRGLSETLVRVASAGTTSLGEDAAERRAHFISFVSAVVDEVAADDPNALVMFDSTNARAHWRWLADGSIGRSVFLEERSAPAPKSWERLRLVRLREGGAGRVGVLKSRSWQAVTRN